MSKPNLHLACEKLKSGGLIAYPTEAVWGLGCDPYNEQAITKLLKLKQRSIEQGLILVAANTDQIAPLLATLTDLQREQLNESWPGPITWLIPDRLNLYPAWIKGSHHSVAIRVSAHPLVKELCEIFGNPIVSTSANLAGQPEIRSRLKIAELFRHSIACIVSGELGSETRTSEIRDLDSGRVIR